MPIPGAAPWDPTATSISTPRAKLWREFGGKPTGLQFECVQQIEQLQRIEPAFQCLDLPNVALWSVDAIC